jgi:aspartyl-tRNA synthetase
MSTSYKRSHNCGQLRTEQIGQTVSLSGWVHRRRDHGGLIFIDLRDRFGLTQLVIDPENIPEAHKLRAEWVITIDGEVIHRAEGMSNPKLKTGEIEITVKEMEVLSKAKTPPFSICDESIEANEEIRLRYRYLDIRRGQIADNLINRHKVMLATRNYLDGEGFLEISTPILGKSTPEGARDYLVPSRVHPGTFYALPQSPQIFKQLIMVSGMDRYFQIAPCFRDEDLRADRQPEFTQIDIEMSFSTPDDLMEIMERLLKHIFEGSFGIDMPPAIRKMTHKECIERYGTDKPDTRFGMEFVNLSDIAERSDFTVFKEQVATGNIVKGIRIPGGADISRKFIDEYTKFVGQFGIAGLAWMKMQEGGLASSIVKFFNEDLQKELIERAELQPGDLLFMIADEHDRTNQGLDHLRRKIAHDRNMIGPNKYEFLWVTDFPLFEWDDEDGRLYSVHHPFTSPHPDDIDLFDSDPLKVRSSGYDIVLNGYEIGGGSQRIHDFDLQKKIFEKLQLSEKEQQEKFGFFIDALSYGTPPHLGIAFGLDRIMMIINQTDNIRDVIAFPKTQKASDLMMHCPSGVGIDQLDELGIELSDDSD